MLLDCSSTALDSDTSASDSVFTENTRTSAEFSFTDSSAINVRRDDSVAETVERSESGSVAGKERGDSVAETAITLVSVDTVPPDVDSSAVVMAVTLSAEVGAVTSSSEDGLAPSETVVLAGGFNFLAAAAALVGMVVFIGVTFTFSLAPGRGGLTGGFSDGKGGIAERWGGVGWVEP